MVECFGVNVKESALVRSAKPREMTLRGLQQCADGGRFVDRAHMSGFLTKRVGSRPQFSQSDPLQPALLSRTTPHTLVC